MKKIIKVGILAALALFALPVSAHQPKLISVGQTEIKVEKPEISTAYYHELNGQAAVYSISSSKPFRLYVNLLSPQTEGARQDFSAKIYKNGKLMTTLDGIDYTWLVMYEPFGNDYYNQGPEFEAYMEAGEYSIEVSNPGNSGKYALAVGINEQFNLSDIAGTLSAMPTLKKDFFGKSPWSAFNNLIGLFLFMFVLIFCAIAYYLVLRLKNYRLKKKLDAEYAKNRPAG